MRVVGAPKLVYKISVLGDADVGKTTLVHRLISDCLPEAAEPTSGCGYSNYDITVAGKLAPCEIWDTAGQERFGSLVPVYIRGTDLCLICVCLNSTRELQLSSIKRWTGVLHSVSEGARVIIVGTKADLVIATPSAPTPSASAIVTSSLTGTGISELREVIASEIGELIYHHSRA